MIVRDKRNPEKIFLTVRADHLPDGRVVPRMFRVGDDRPVMIDRIVDVCQAPALKMGGQGTRYTCRIEGKEIYLFHDRELWFMEEC